jgi:acyl carrier protein
MDENAVSANILELLAGISIVSRDDLTTQSALIGEKGVVDSHGLLQLLLALEDYADESFGARFEWMTDTAFSTERSPFRNVATLTSFFTSQLSAANSG